MAVRVNPAARLVRNHNMSSPVPIAVLWLKRDLRLSDHAALCAAAKSGRRVLPVYIAEPDYWALPDTSFRQWRFISGCLEDVSARISARGGALYVARGDAVDVFENLKSHYSDIEIFSHEETGNGWTYARDRRVAKWAKTSGTPWHEFTNFGVFRGSLANRDRWASMWETVMRAPVLGVPDVNWAKPPAMSDIPSPVNLGLSFDGIKALQPPGRDYAIATLNSFLFERGETYQKDMSSPVTGELACSRLSPYMAYGSLSVREIYAAALTRAAELKARARPDEKMWRASINSFLKRLHWHCHFIQKFETEPEIETLPMARIYDSLRPASDSYRLWAFETGMTGYPFVDACMRYLTHYGWINFRMRAMLQSFASYHLWLRWQDSGQIMARLFTDYEPGIHWSQCQMQSGETGINTVRIYAPVKQGLDQDPSGDFTREWVPELSGLSGASVHEPWKYRGAEDLFAVDCGDYPGPIVDHKAAVKAARDAIFKVRATVPAKREAQAVYQKHGSRRRPRRIGARGKISGGG